MTTQSQAPQELHPIQVEGLSRTYRKVEALHNVNLVVPRGVVYGLVGENGAGKTTLMRHLLGLLRPQAGTVRIFGLDPTRDPAGALSRIGYLSEDRDLPDWMTVAEVMAYTRAFYPKWDPGYAEQLRERFLLPPEAKTKGLSRGQLAKLGLLLALAHRPELLLLDEPSSGLDPLVRREILEAIIRTVAEEGRTVFLSSHLLDEVERVCDVLTMLSGGRIVLQGPVDEIKEKHRSLTLRFADAPPVPPEVAGCRPVGGAGREWTFVCNGNLDEVKARAAEAHAEIIDARGASLDEIFVSRTGANLSKTEV